MSNSRQDLLNLLTVKSETIKLDCLKNTNLKDMEFTLKEMSISQHRKYREIISDTKDKDRFNKSMIIACRSVLVEPEFFTDEELENMNGIGELIINEIFTKIPTIGMSEKEKEKYHENIKKVAENMNADENSTLIESYQNDRNIVDTLKPDELKILCKEYDIKYQNANQAKADLKSLSEDKEEKK